MIEEKVIEANATSVLEPMYQSLCGDIEGMMGELPIGSYVKMTASTFQVIMPLNGITDMFGSKATIIFEAKAFAQAYKDAMHFLEGFQRVVNE